MSDPHFSFQATEYCPKMWVLFNGCNETFLHYLLKIEREIFIFGKNMKLFIKKNLQENLKIVF